jgi:DNA-binding CsgD family transcriptional regulator/PAS domain-containing protein
MEANGGAAPELVECVYQAVTCDEAWREVLSRLGEDLAAEAAILAHHDADAGGGALLHSVGLDTELAARYAAEFAPKNPWMVDAKRYRPGHVFVGEDVIPNADLVRTEFYVDYLRPLNLLHRLCGVADRIGNEHLFFAVLRRPEQSPFQEHDRRTITPLLAHARRALELGRELRVERSRRQTLLDVLDQLPTAVLVLDAEAKPIFLNAAAEEILALNDGLVMQGRRLRALWRGETERLQRVVASACQPQGPAADAGGHMTITRPSGCRPFLLIVNPLPRPVAGEGWHSRPVATIVIKDPESEPAQSARNLRELAELYGLTPAETRLAGLILNGLALFEAAERLGITKNTARTHMKRIYGKTGTRRQVELVRRLGHLALDSN